MFRRPGGLRGLEVAALDALARGRMVPLLTRFPLAEAAAAHAALENRETIGKVVLIP
jgi:NADPH2:quinone reductase